MIPLLPGYINFLFMLTVLSTLVIFFYAIKRSSRNYLLILMVMLVWLVIQGVLAFQGFYLDKSSIPPNFLFATVPPFVAIILLFTTTSGKKLIDGISIPIITYLNTVRIPVELVLYWLFLNKVIPEIMTFEGRNFDIFAGISAPFVAYLTFTRRTLNLQFLMVWNIICLALLLNIMINAIFAAPFPFQKFAFDQPNIAVLYYPFVWLPSFIVPVILFGHLVSIRKIIKGIDEYKKNKNIASEHSNRKEVNL